MIGFAWRLRRLTRLVVVSGFFFVCCCHGFVRAEDVTLRAFRNIDDSPPPLPASESLERIEVRDGFVVELVASEPLVKDPVAFAWGVDGELWVVEMADYPLGMDDRGKPGGRVRFLEDVDGDGRYDRSTLFAEELSFPTGVAPWRDGVLITAAPAILYGEDTDGDGKADVLKELYRGFFEGNQQHRVNTLGWGLDGWIHVANGDSGGTVRSVRTQKEIELRGRDLRIQPDTGLLELESGQTQFGRSRDDWGNWFGCANPVPIFHFVLSEHYLARNPHVVAPHGKHQIVDGATAGVYPISRVLSHWRGYVPPQAGERHRFTSCCGVCVYRDDFFGPAFASSTFTSAPIHNVVHRRVLEPEGVSFKSVRADDEGDTEFLRSSDSWFRPTSLRTGPDGSLWIADMYRLVLEHPEWIDDTVEKTLDLRAGHDKGRIYRVYPRGKTPRPLPPLGALGTGALVEAIESPNGWQRDMVQQLLTWRGDDAVAPRLEEKVRRSPRARVRLQALSTLETLGALRVDVLIAAMRDPHPGVRRHAIRLCEERTSVEAGRLRRLGDALLERLDDPELSVQLQLASTLGAWPAPRAAAPLARLAIRHSTDKHLGAAILSSLNRDNIVSVLGHLVEPGVGDLAPEFLRGLFDSAIAMGGASERARVLTWVTDALDGNLASWKLGVFGDVLDAFEREGRSITNLRTRSGESLDARLASILAAARDRLRDSSAPLEARRAAAALLGREPQRREADLEALRTLLGTQTPGELRQVAVERLAGIGGPSIPEILVGGWSGYGPRLRGAVLDALMGRGEWHEALVGFLEDGRVAPGDFNATRRQQLLRQVHASLQQRTRAALASVVDPDRARVVEQLEPTVLALHPRRVQGERVFREKCASCHHADGVGSHVGPSFGGLKDRSVRTLLVAILDPNRAVEEKFRSYVAVKNDGQVITGILRSESGASVELRVAEGQQHSVLRSELATLEATGASLMPEGLEKDLSAQDLADVIAFVGSIAVLPRDVSGNQPELMSAGADGSFVLTARGGELYGEQLVVDEPSRAIEGWQKPDDHVIWSLDVRDAGLHEAWLEWASVVEGTGVPDGAVGRYALDTSSGASLGGVFASTGDLRRYRREKVGTLELPAGLLRVAVQPLGALDQGVVRLREVTLVPVTSAVQR